MIRGSGRGRLREVARPARVAAGHGSRTRPPGRRRADCQAGPLHPLGRRPCLVDRHVQPPRGGTYQCSRVSGHQQRRRAPRGQRARRRRAVGAGSHGGAHVSSAPGAQAAGPRHRPAGWRPTVSSSSTDAGHGTRASRKRLQRSSSTGRANASTAPQRRASGPPVHGPGYQDTTAWPGACRGTLVTFEGPVECSAAGGGTVLVTW